MKVLNTEPFESAASHLRSARLRITAPRIAVMQALQGESNHWFSAESLYRTLVERGVETSLGTLYRVMNEMAACGLLLRQVDENGKRFFRYRPTHQILHQVVCRDTGQVLALVDDISVDHVASALRTTSFCPSVIHCWRCPRCR